jgi:hypothetical protein
VQPLRGETGSGFICEDQAAQATEAELLSSALECFRVGRFAEAEEAYVQILARKPDHADCVHHLGLIAHQRGDHAAASVLIVRFLERDDVSLADKPFWLTTAQGQPEKGSPRTYVFRTAPDSCVIVVLLAIVARIILNPISGRELKSENHLVQLLTEVLDSALYDRK